MTQVNPHASPHVSVLFDNLTQPSSRRGVFWLVTVCLFLSVAVLNYLAHPVLWLIMVPLWFLPIIMSDMRAGARYADPRRSGANSSIDRVAKAIGIMFSIIVFSFLCVVFIDMNFFPCRCAGCLHLPKFEEFINDKSRIPNEQPVLPIHSLGNQ